MHKLITDKEEEPIRLFQSSFLEFFTHIHPLVIVIIWVPVIVFFLILAFEASQPVPIGQLLAGYLTGLFIWTFAEYTLHRFLFHFKPMASWQERIAFLFHGVHHAQPQDKTRLVMPPVVSIPMALLAYGIIRLFLHAIPGGVSWEAQLMAGFLTGYLFYDLTHYATHHFPIRGGVFKYLKRYHMQHHYKTPMQRFGVTSPLWDRVFRTFPAD